MILSRAQPTELPFSLANLKRHCRIDASFTADDEILTMYAWAAVRNGEFITNRVWAGSEWSMTLEEFPLFNVISVPRSPCGGVISISYVDDNEIEQAVDPAAYRFTASSFEWDGGLPFGFIRASAGWPSGSNVTVKFMSGWPQGELPEELVQWSFIKISSKYEQREDLASAARKIAIGFPRNFADGLLDPWYLPKDLPNG